MKKFFFLFSTLSFAVFFANFSAEALTVSPVKMELAGDPGQTVGGTFELYNEEETEKTFYISYSNFEAEGESGAPHFLGDADGLATWIHLQPPELVSITLAPGQKETVPYVVNIPADAQPGGYFAALFWGTQPELEEDDLELAVGAKVGILLFLSVKGDLGDNKGGLLEFDALDGKRFFTSQPISFFYRIQNPGLDRLIPTGTLTIRNMLGIKDAEIQLNTNQSNVLPTSIRRFEEMWGVAPPSVEMSFFETVDFQLKNFALGYYKAELDVMIAEESAASKIGFWILPWQLLSLALGLLLILFSVGGFLLGQYNKWIISRALAYKKSAAPKKSPAKKRRK